MIIDTDGLRAKYAPRWDGGYDDHYPGAVEADVKALADALDATTTERDTYRGHSVTLNTVGYQMGRALGYLQPGGDSIEASPVALATELIGDRDEARDGFNQAERARLDRETTIADLRAQLDRATGRQQALAGILGDLLRGAWESGHPGYPAVRTHWIRAERVDEWRTLLPTYAAPAPGGDGRAKPAVIAVGDLAEPRCEAPQGKGCIHPVTHVVEYWTGKTALVGGEPEPLIRRIHSCGWCLEGIPHLRRSTPIASTPAEQFRATVDRAERNGLHAFAAAAIVERLRTEVDRCRRSAAVYTAEFTAGVEHALQLALLNRTDRGDRGTQHPEDVCYRCGGPNVAWAAPSPLWNEVMRGGDINAADRFGGIVCPTCFAILAECGGVGDLWRLSAFRVHTPLKTVTPSGRVWNEQTWMWDEPPAGEPRPATEDEVREALSGAPLLDGVLYPQVLEAPDLPGDTLIAVSFDGEGKPLDAVQLTGVSVADRPHRFDVDPRGNCAACGGTRRDNAHTGQSGLSRAESNARCDTCGDPLDARHRRDCPEANRG